MALYLRKKLDNKAEIAVWHVTESEEELLGLTSVPNDELEEISLFRSESQRRQKLAVRALINEVFEEKMYLNHHDNGQPYLENCATNISITHTENYVAIIIHDDEEVGIDVESLDRDFSVVEKKALSEDEIDDLEKDKRNEQLAIYWCAKEAIYKRMSQNRVVYAEQIEVEKFNVRKEGELEATFIHKDEHEEEFELEYMVFDRHVLVWLVG
jgi:phosphopantetheine--protein transferase-like protein